VTKNARLDAAARADGRGALGDCPGCRSGRLVTIRHPDDTNLRCQDCGRCWHAGTGCWIRVDPLTCVGCPDRRSCQARLPEGDPFRPHQQSRLSRTADAVPGEGGAAAR
jgi:hypothetical protein